MAEKLSNKKTYTYRKMDFYVDRGKRADAINVRRGFYICGISTIWIAKTIKEMFLAINLKAAM